MADDCNTCGGSGDVSDTSEMLPESTNTPPAELAPTVPCPAPTTVIKRVSCSTIKDECHDCDPSPIPFARIQLANAFPLPACNQEVEAVFKEDISNLMVGLTVFAVDANQKTIRLRITKITPDNKLTLKNMCSSCCGSTKPVGETIIAETYFSWGLPDCCAASSTVDADACLVGTFFFPAAGATSPANVPNSNIFVLGGLYSLGGFIWKVTARVTTGQILLQNPSPGNGSTVGGSIEGGTDGVCVYPITPISSASECDDSPVDAVTLIGCTSAGKKKLTSDKACGYVRFDKTNGSFSAVDLLGGSTITGPHYIQWDKDNPCNSKLVSAPQLVGTQCTTITAPIFLTPTNASQEYEVSVETTAPLTITAPNNIVTILGRQYTVLAIVAAGTPGVVRVKPRFAVGVSETVPETSQMCVVEGCQPFPKADYLLPGDLEDLGMKIFCSDDGLRTYPIPTSFIGINGINFATDIGGIETGGTHDQPNIAVNLTNPSTVYPANVLVIVEYRNKLRLDDDGVWVCQTLTGLDTPAGVLTDEFEVSSQNGQKDITVRMSASLAVTLAPGQTKVLNIVPRLLTTNSSANSNLLWLDCNGRVTAHFTAP